MKMLKVALCAVAALALAGCTTRRIEPPPSQAVLEARARAQAAKVAPPDRCAAVASFSTTSPLMVPFAYNRSELTEEARRLLDQAAVWLSCNPGVYVTLTAAHDNQGAAQVQKALVEARRTAVQGALTAGGVDASRLLAYQPTGGGTLVIDARGRGW